MPVELEASKVQLPVGAGISEEKVDSLLELLEKKHGSKKIDVLQDVEILKNEIDLNSLPDSFFFTGECHEV